MKDSDLKYGQAYECIINGNLGIQKTIIVPLSINDKKTRRFIIVDAGKLHTKKPRLLEKLRSMTFSEIIEEDLGGSPDREWSSYVWNVALREESTLYCEDFDAYFVDFVEVELI